MDSIDDLFRESRERLGERQSRATFERYGSTHLAGAYGWHLFSNVDHVDDVATAVREIGGALVESGELTPRKQAILEYAARCHLLNQDENDGRRMSADKGLQHVATIGDSLRLRPDEQRLFESAILSLTPRLDPDASVEIPPDWGDHVIAQAALNDAESARFGTGLEAHRAVMLAAERAADPALGDGFEAAISDHGHPGKAFHDLRRGPLWFNARGTLPKPGDLPDDPRPPSDPTGPLPPPPPLPPDRARPVRPPTRHRPSASSSRGDGHHCRSVGAPPTMTRNRHRTGRPRCHPRPPSPPRGRATARRPPRRSLARTRCPTRRTGRRCRAGWTCRHDRWRASARHDLQGRRRTDGKAGERRTARIPAGGCGRDP
jgi:hypothetical protein